MKLIKLLFKTLFCLFMLSMFIVGFASMLLLTFYGKWA